MEMGVDINIAIMHVYDLYDCDYDNDIGMCA